MRRVMLVAALSLSTTAMAQQQKPMTLKAVLLEQLRSTHNKAEWFVPANTAVAGLTPAQASWTDESGNHSVGQLANHLVFWDRESLAKFKGELPFAVRKGLMVSFLTAVKAVFSVDPFAIDQQGRSAGSRS
jgi:hypothetical protein